MPHNICTKFGEFLGFQNSPKQQNIIVFALFFKNFLENSKP
jgi:hypothetical protein